MNKYIRSMNTTFLVGSLFIGALVVVIDPTAIAQTHDDLLAPDVRLVHETDRVPTPGRTNDPAAERQMFESIKVASSSEDRRTLLVGTILDPKNQGLYHTTVTLTEADGTRHEAISDPFGTFRFEEINAGQQIRLSAENAQYSFTDLSIALSGETSVGWRADGR